MNTASNESQSGTGAGQYLTFVLAGEEYGVEILKVQEIRGWEAPTALPNTAAHILGVLNLRGTVVPVVDLRQRFALAAKESDKTTVVVVVRVLAGGKERTVGMVVDAVSEVYSVEAEAIRPAPDLGGAISAEYVTGLASVGEKMVILLDVDRLVDEGVMRVAAA
jgi:purine-binding chemotaxis protein CheW